MWQTLTLLGYQISWNNHRKVVTQRIQPLLFREAAKNSIGSTMPAKSLELKHTIKLIQELTSEIDEIGDFNRFDASDKILAYAGFSPSTYQSGQLDDDYSHMEKRGSRYLRYALYNAAKYVYH